MAGAAITVRSIKVAGAVVTAHERAVPAEVPVALVYNGSTYAVMMASPSDLEDFAIGFSLTEGIVASAEEIASLDVIHQAKGVELRLWLVPGRGRSLAERRRRIAGPTGCGLCGVESLKAAVPDCPQVSAGLSVHPEDVAAALAALAPAQTLHQRTRAVHGAGFWTKAHGLVALAEDVGRHNALDKLVGRLHRERIDAGGGVVLLTSRVSVEMVQKAAAAGAPVLVAVSAPTALAVETAERAGITLAAIATGTLARGLHWRELASFAAGSRSATGVDAMTGELIFRPLRNLTVVPACMKRWPWRAAPPGLAGQSRLRRRRAAPPRQSKGWRERPASR